MFGARFRTGFGDPVLNMVVAYFLRLNSHFAGQQGYVKKTDNAVAFLNVAPVQLHRENCKQLHEGDDI
jgi:hypothetical protein